MAKNVAISISASNIGPLANPAYQGEKRESNTTLIYARNGSGKTFLSRMFRLFEDGSSARTKNLLTFNETVGSFAFGITGKDNKKKVGSVELRAGFDPAVKNDTGCLFHVFNGDYVRDSVAKSGYAAPNGIKGYIVGKDNVDADEERAEVARIQGELDDVRARIETSVLDICGEVKASGVRTTLGEYRKIAVDSILSNPLPLTETYAAQLENYRKLSAVSDDDVQLEPPLLSCDDDLVASLRRLLSTPFRRDEFAREFVEHVNSHLDFIRTGVAAVAENGEACPFCGQPLGPSAAELICSYEKYLDAAEAKARLEIEGARRRLEALGSEVARWGRSAYLASDGLREAVEMYPSLRGVQCPPNPGPDPLLDAVRCARSALLEKSAAIDVVLSEEPIDFLEGALGEIRAYEAQVAELIKMANKARSNGVREKRQCANALCEQARLKLRISMDGEVRDHDRLSRELDEAQKRLRALEEQSREPKRERVAAIFRKLLWDFFGDKYVFDPKTFVLGLGSHKLTDDSELVLSEGEKTVVAFCIYLASTVELIERDEDWNSLFFVIDDPISSLDYDRVYTMVGCIADIKRVLGMAESARLRFLVLTHNFSFFNIFAAGRAPSNLLVLERGELRDAREREMFPFEQHLADVIRVAEGEIPSHTTGNSIRHVVEWAWHIQSPDLERIGDYIGACDGLKCNPALSHICNDLSHGGHERDAGRFDEDLSSACKTVLEFMENAFAGQVANTRKRFMGEQKDPSPRKK